MTAHLKQAAITVAVVLAGIYILRRIPGASGIVDTALNG